jgi:hypothetical protein
MKVPEEKYFTGKKILPDSRPYNWRNEVYGE